MKHLLPKTALVLCIWLLFSAFRHTDIEGFEDPAFPDYRFDNVVVHVPNATLDFKKAILAQLKKYFRKLKIRMYEHDELFPPTRQWTEDKTREVYEQYGVEAGLVITIGNAGSETSPGGVLYNTSSLNGSTTGYATQINQFRDSASFEIALVDVDSQATVWFGRLDTRGAGLLFTGKKNTAGALAKGIFKEWKSAGYLPKR